VVATRSLSSPAYKVPGNAFRDLKDVKLYPSIGMKKPGAHLSVNFGQRPFVFDIDGMMVVSAPCPIIRCSMILTWHLKAEKMRAEEEINLTSASALHRPLDETALIQELVAQFLAHDGYVETARAFADEVRAESQALQNGRDSRFKDLGAEDDLDAVNRQRKS